jgi:hypothetical protein
VNFETPTEREAKHAEIQKRRKLKRDREMGDLRTILGMPEGRRLLWRVLSQAQVFTASYTGDQHTFFNEGKRNIGIWLLEDILHSKPEAFHQMQREAVSEQKKEEGHS